MSFLIIVITFFCPTVPVWALCEKLEDGDLDLVEEFDFPLFGSSLLEGRVVFEEFGCENITKRCMKSKFYSFQNQTEQTLCKMVQISNIFKFWPKNWVWKFWSYLKLP